MKQFYPIVLLFAIIFSTLSPTLEAQNYPLDNIYWQGYPLNNDYSSQNVVFYFYEYQSENLDLRHFRLSNPQLRLIIPKKVKVKLPPMKWAKDTTYAVAYITNGELKDGSLVLMIIADANSNIPTFFIDQDLDRDFSDEKAVVFPNANKKYRSIAIKDKYDKSKKYDFLLLNPMYQENIRIESHEVPQKEDKEITMVIDELPKSKQDLLDIREFNKKSFYVNIDGFVGTGKLRYQLETPVDYYPYVEYELNYIPRGFAVEMGYIYKNFQINLVGAYENLYYYTSTLDTSFMQFIDTKGELKTPKKTLTNIDRLPNNKYSYGLDFGYNLNLGEKIALTPFVQYTRYNYKENQYNADTRKVNKIFALQERYAIGGGLTLKMMVSPKSLITYRIVYQKLNFNPEGFFPAETEVENFQLELEQVLIGLGYTLKLF